MKFLRRLLKKPLIARLTRVVVIFVANREARRIAKHFSEFLEPYIAVNKEHKNTVFGIRHNVYCEELKFEPENEDKIEKDEFDAHAHHCLIQHKSSKKHAGTVRIVYSQNEDMLLPLEKYCLDSIDHPTLKPTNFPRDSICEISRLAVPAEFRRRQSDKFDGAATGVINADVYSKQELRCFPFIAIGLYLSAANVVMKEGIDHVFVMMEPRLARSLRLVGINFQSIGPVIDYHGKRAPYYIPRKGFEDTLPIGFKALFDKITTQFDAIELKKQS